MTPEFQEQLAQAMADQQTKTELQEQLQFSDTITGVVIEDELPTEFVNVTYSDSDCAVSFRN